MSNELSVSAEYRGKMKYLVTNPVGKEIMLDYLKPLGDYEGFTPLELLLASLAGCAGGTISPLMKKFGMPEFKLKINARGVRTTEHPTVFTSISMEFNFSGSNLNKENLEKIVTIAEEKYCPVWAMLKKSVNIERKIEIT